MTSATSKVSDRVSASIAGRKSTAPPATACAAPVMMVDSLKPTPVSVTTPITMPTEAAAAPTANAYFAGLEGLDHAPRPMRPRMKSSHQRRCAHEHRTKDI
jgi:hypothetical protein